MARIVANGGQAQGRQDGNGGPPKISSRYNGPSVTVVRDPNVLDNGIIRNKQPWYHHAYRTPPPLTQPSWNDSGPVPMSLHLRTFTYRREAGQFNSDTNGMHTMLPPVSAKKDNRKPQAIRGGRQNRLSVAIYRGQTYSETTIKQGDNK